MNRSQRNPLLWLAVLLLAVLLPCQPAGAKWWIFGQANDQVDLSYLYLNNLSYEESGPKLTLYKDLLPKGEVVLRGKARIRRGKIGQIRISIDDRQTWREARFSDNGGFEFHFRPEAGRTYVLFVEVSDTAGKTNDVEATRKELFISDSRTYQVVLEVLKELVDAYQAEDPVRFMARISEDFAGDATLLDRAVRQDFSAFDNIDLRVTLNSLAPDPSGKIYVSLTYSRFVISSRSGGTYSDRGVTEFIFAPGDQGPVVYAMKNPLIFGLSDAANVATGTVVQSGNEPCLLVDGRGNTAQVPFDLFVKLVGDDTLTITSNPDGTTTVETDDLTVVVTDDGHVVGTQGGGGTVESGTNILIRSEGHPPVGFDFVAGEVAEPPDAAFVIAGGDGDAAWGFLEAGNVIRDMGVVDLDDLHEAPADGYHDASQGYEFRSGHTYAFRLANGRYVLMEVKTVDVTYPAPGMPGHPTVLMRMDYKYQTDGSRNF